MEYIRSNETLNIVSYITLLSAVVNQKKENIQL